MDLSQFRLSSDRRLFKGAARNLSTGYVAGSPFDAGRTLNIGRTNDESAVEVTLKSRRPPQTNQTTPGEAQKAAEQDRPRAAQSGLRAFLKSITDITSRLETLNGELKKSPEDSPARAAIDSEIAELNNQYARIFGTDQAKKMTEVLGAVENSIRSGASSRAVAAALAPEAALLGTDFLNLVKGGSLSGLRTIAQSFGTLANLSSSGLKVEDLSLGLAQKALKDIAQTLDQSTAPAVDPAPVIVTTQKAQIAPPTMVDLAFKNAGKMALQLKTYIGEDAIHAAMAHLPFDPDQALQLLPPDRDPSASKTQKEKEEERRQLDLKFDRARQGRDDRSNKSDSAVDTPEDASATTPKTRAVGDSGSALT